MNPATYPLGAARSDQLIAGRHLGGGVVPSSGGPVVRAVHDELPGIPERPAPDQPDCRLAIVDVETLGLDAERHPMFEVAVILATHIPTAKTLHVERTLERMLAVTPDALAAAEPTALRIARFYAVDGALRFGVPSRRRSTSAQLLDLVCVPHQPGA